MAPHGKVEGLKMQLRQALGYSFIGTKALASIIGKIISLSLALAPVARLMTRSILHC